MANVENLQPYLEPLRKTVIVPRTPGEAFEIFTARMAGWWPIESYSVFGAESAGCGIEPRAGGDVYEHSKGGERCVWGSILAWDPPNGFTMSWHPGNAAESATEVELRFTPVAGGTRVELEHRNWTRFGERAKEAHDTYSSGWALVFEQRYAEACQ